MIFEDIVFIHIPKTAGSSIQNSLIKKNKLIYEGSRSFYEHISADENMTLHKSKIKAKSFRRHLPLELIKLSKFHISKPVITFIRNPFSRAVSLYYECIRSEFYRRELKLNEKSAFYDFLTSINNEQYWFTLPMIDWIGGNNLNNIDYIGKFETIDEDINQINKKIKIDIKLKHHNYNNSIGGKYSPPNYIHHYKKDITVRLVKQIYKKDFQNFDYNFENFKTFEKKKVNKFFILSNLIKRKIKNIF